MEQQKLLWIIFSVALLLIVVIGVGFIWFFPAGKGIVYGTTAPKIAGAVSPADNEPGFDPIQWVRGSEDFPGLTEKKEPTDDFVIVYGESDNGKAAESETLRTPATSGLSVQAQPVPERKTEKVEEPAAAAPIAAVPTVKLPSVPKQITIKEYWIQAGSYVSMYRAERVKQELAVKGVVSRITSKTVNDQTYFRVRIGPYQNSGEAEKFLSWIQEVSGFENSYVSQIYTKKTVE